MYKIIRVTTISKSLRILLKGQLSYMKQFYEIIGISSGTDFLNEVAKNEGIVVHEITMTRSITPFKDLQALFKLCKIFRKEKPIIVHSHTPKAGFLAMLAAKFCKIPIRLHTVAGLPLVETQGFKKFVLILVEKITYLNSTKIYPNSYGLKEIIITNKYCTESKIKVIGNGSSNGIDPKFFSKEVFNDEEIDNIRKSYRLNPEDFIFIYIGRLVKNKGINELIMAFNVMSKNYSNVKLLLLGVQEEKLDPLQNSTIDIINNHPAIINVGWKADVRPYLALSDVLVFPSYREGLPNVPLQACAMDIPCIVSNINGCNEIINHEYNGLLVPVKDCVALRLAMERLLNEKDLYISLKSVTRKSVIDKYNQECLWRNIKEEYDSQISNISNQ